MLDLAFPALGWWPLAFVGVAARARRRSSAARAWGALLVGFAFGASFYLVHIVWITRATSAPVPWFALSMLEAVLMAVGAVPIALAYRWMPRVLPARWARLDRCCRCSSRGLWTAAGAVRGLVAVRRASRGAGSA